MINEWRKSVDRSSAFVLAGYFTLFAFFASRVGSPVPGPVDMVSMLAALVVLFLLVLRFYSRGHEGRISILQILLAIVLANLIITTAIGVVYRPTVSEIRDGGFYFVIVSPFVGAVLAGIPTSLIQLVTSTRYLKEGSKSPEEIEGVLEEDS